jgi:MATE family multidrug resistance protein
LLFNSFKLIQVIQSGNYSTDVQAGIMLAGNLWFPIMVGIGGVLFFVTPMIAQLYGAKNLKEIGPLARQAFWLGHTNYSYRNGYSFSSILDSHRS